MKKSEISKLVDTLGELKAKKAVIDREEKELTGKLKEEGDGIYLGTLFRAAVSSYDMETYDTQALVEKLLELGQKKFVQKQRKTKTCTRVTVHAHVCEQA